MKTALNILIKYLTCTDAVMVTKWQNILASFWHKDEGQIITEINTEEQQIVVKTVDADGTATVTTIAQYNEPETFTIEKIEGLTGALEGKVAVVVGKGLSTNDYTEEDRQKLANLTNYTHPEAHTIGEVTGLADLLTQIQEAQTQLNETLSTLSQYQFIIWHGYRLYKMSGGVATYPEALDEIQGRGDGTLEDGENIHIEAVNPMPDIALVTNSDYKLFTKYP